MPEHWLPDYARRSRQPTPSEVQMQKIMDAQPDFGGATQLVARWKALRRGVQIWPRAPREDDWDPERRK